MTADHIEIATRAAPVREPLRNKVRRWKEYARRYRRLQLNMKQQYQVLPSSRARAADPANRTHFLINYPGSPNNIDSLVAWLPLLDQLSAQAPVAILVGDVSAYESARAATGLPCYFGRVASEAEYVAQQMQTKVMLYINQSKLNLREGGFHDMFHVFLGAPGNDRRKWLNNRMRLYDYVLAPDRQSQSWLKSRLMSFDAERRVRVVGRAQPEPDTPLDHLGSHLRSSNVIERGVDPDAAVAELIRIRDERDQLVAERDRMLEEQGIVLLKGGQA